MTQTSQLPIKPLAHADGKRSIGWWGVWTLIVTEGSLFGYLLLSYYYLAAQTEVHWPPEGLPKLVMPGINTVILLSSSIFVWLSERCIRHSRMRLSLLPMGIAVVLGLAFVVVQSREWSNKDYGITSNLYGSLYFTITGFHVVHVIIGLTILCLLLLWTGLGYFNPKRYGPIVIGGLYWHFVDVVWLFIFSTFYLLPYLQEK